MKNALIIATLAITTVGLCLPMNPANAEHAKSGTTGTLNTKRIQPYDSCYVQVNNSLLSQYTVSAVAVGGQENWLTSIDGSGFPLYSGDEPELFETQVYQPGAYQQVWVTISGTVNDAHEHFIGVTDSQANAEYTIVNGPGTYVVWNVWFAAGGNNVTIETI